MPSAATVRIEIENALERRFPAALTPAIRSIREVAPTGIPAVDDDLDIVQLRMSAPFELNRFGGTHRK